MNLELTSTNRILFYTSVSGVTLELAKYSASPSFVLWTSSTGSMIVTVDEQAGTHKGERGLRLVRLLQSAF